MMFGHKTISYKCNFFGKSNKRIKGKRWLKGEGLKDWRLKKRKQEPKVSSHCLEDYLDLFGYLEPLGVF